MMNLSSNHSHTPFKRPSFAITTNQSRIAFFGYILLYILGSIGHTGSFLIFLQANLRRISTSCLFIALTLSDSIYLLMSIYEFINVGVQIPDNSFNPSTMCRFRHYIELTVMCCNAWLLVAITIDRWMRVALPFKSKQFCTAQNAFLTTIVIFSISAIINTHALHADYIQLPGGVMTICGPKVENAVYHRFVREIWPTLFACIQTLIPVTLLMSFSIDIFYRLARRPLHQNPNHSSRRSQLDRLMLLVMLTNAILFVVTTLPLGLFNILLPPVFHERITRAQALEITSIVTFVSAINYALSFYMHCLTSPLFRQEFLHIFSRSPRNSRTETFSSVLQIDQPRSQTIRVQE